MSRAGAGPVDLGTFRLLYVCTGNICRSAFAEIFTRHLLAERLGGETAAGFDVSSAGTHAVAGTVHPGIRAELHRLAVPDALADRFTARQLIPATLEAGDLVLGAEPAHRSAAVSYAPVALPVAFALREFARLVAAVDPDALPVDPVERAHALVGEAHRLRGLLPREPPAAHRLPDPIGGPATAYRDAAAQVADAVARIVDLLTLPRGAKVVRLTCPPPHHR